MMSSGAAPVNLPSAALSLPGHLKEVFIQKKMRSDFLFKRGLCSFNRDLRQRTLVSSIQPNATIKRAEIPSIRAIRVHKSHVLTMKNHCHSKKLLWPYNPLFVEVQGSLTRSVRRCSGFVLVANSETTSTLNGRKNKFGWLQAPASQVSSTAGTAVCGGPAWTYLDLAVSMSLSSRNVCTSR
jgi:hypothetical protein